MSNNRLDLVRGALTELGATVRPDDDFGDIYILKDGTLVCIREIERGCPVLTSDSVAAYLATNDSIRAIKQLRRDIDDKIQTVKALPGSRELSLVVTKLQEGVMWLGMELKRINDATGIGENPYPNSKDPSNTKIDPTADGLKF
jgi:hypothetical protein